MLHTVPGNSKVKVKLLSHVRLFGTPWITCQAPLSMGFSRQEYWSGLLFPSPGYLPNPGLNPRSPALAGGCFTTEPPGMPIMCLPTIIFLILYMRCLFMSGTRPGSSILQTAIYPQLWQRTMVCFWKTQQMGSTVVIYPASHHTALCYIGEVKICLPGTVFPEPNVSRCSRYHSSYFTNHSLSHPESLGYTFKFKISYPGCSCPMFHFQ